MHDEENGIIDQVDDALEGGELPSVKEPAAEALRILEALLFASDELLTAARLKAILPGNPDGREVGKMVERINRQLQKERHPFEIVEIGGGYQFKTIAYYHPWVRQIFKEKAAKRLSIQALECLSIIAYRQPLSKAEIEAIRGVISDGAMKTLLEKRLVTITGRSEKAGRPLLYGTTPEFLKYFGLNKIADLPDIQEFEALVRQKMETMPIEALQAVQAESVAAAEAEAQAEAEALIEARGAGGEATIEVSIPKDQPHEGEATVMAEAELFEIKPAAPAPEPPAALEAGAEMIVENMLPDDAAETIVEPLAAPVASKEPAAPPATERKPKKRRREIPMVDNPHPDETILDRAAAVTSITEHAAGDEATIEVSIPKDHPHEGEATVMAEMPLPEEAEETRAHTEEHNHSTDGETVLQAAVPDETEQLSSPGTTEPAQPHDKDGEATFEVKL